MSVRDPAKFPDSSPALVIETKSLEKTRGNFASPEDNVSPLFISSPIDIRILFNVTFFVCFSKTDKARDRESPALIMPLRFLVKIINSAVFTLPKMRAKRAFTLKELPLLATMEIGVLPRERNSRESEKRSSDSIVPSTIPPSFDLAL